MALPPLKDLKITADDVERDALGIGSYGKVVRVKLGKQYCAAKLLHETMFQSNDPGTNKFVQKFKEECELLSHINHPHIVKYLGTGRDPRPGKFQRPVLFMELMHENLTNFLDRSSSPLRWYMQLSIGHDVALALEYLHSKSIVHRDLSSNNVLLTVEGLAKVTDFGMSRLIERNTHLTQCPGSLVYMSPEALLDPPQYSDKLDCFSFGVLSIQIATKEFPKPGDANRYVDDPKYPNGRVWIQIPEVERRKKHLDLLESDHPLLPLALRCLKDRESERPSAHELCEHIAPLKEQEQEREKREHQIKKELAAKELRRRRELEEEAEKEGKCQHKAHPNTTVYCSDCKMDLGRRADEILGLPNSVGAINIYCDRCRNKPRKIGTCLRCKGDYIQSAEDVRDVGFCAKCRRSGNKDASNA